MTSDGRTVGQSDWSRRDFLGSLARAFAFLSISPTVRQSDSVRPTVQQSVDSLPGPAGRLADPVRAGRPLPPIVAADNDAAIQAIEKHLHCTCGCNLDVYTCRTTDFTCTVSPALHRRVVALAEQGKTGPQIIDDFVREHGVAILMAPPKRGFNLAGYFLPLLLIGAAGVALMVVLRRWSRAPIARPASPVPAVAATPEELERLSHELGRLSL